KGYHYIHTAIRDPEIRREVSEAMREGQRGLATRYGQELAGGPEQIEQILGRFENPGLADPIARVGRDPARKLAAHDRLVGAARLAGQAGIPPQHLALAAAAALCFSNPSDLGSGELLRKIEASGLGPSLRSVCGLNPRRGFGKQVHARWSELRQGWLPGNLLLSLDQLLWARSDSNMIV
ncbi:MAG: hypothetical protein H0V96_08900, partial [Acidimicrobiia bacterium]|nr:hypothetical protein [Acidimicrobiia bacterium]